MSNSQLTAYNFTLFIFIIFFLEVLSTQLAINLYLDRNLYRFATR